MGQFDNAGWAPGSVFGLRWWNLEARRTDIAMTQRTSDLLSRLADKPGPPQLALVGMRAPWQPGENTAECQVGHDHRVPDEHCGCGYWAYWQPHSAPLFGQRRVMGVIEGYGQVLIGDLGFRCERARLVALCCQFTEQTPPEFRREVTRQQLDGPPLTNLRGDWRPGSGAMASYVAFGGRPHGEIVETVREVEVGGREDNLAAQVALETELAARYGVPVYATAKYMLAKHPLTTDYLPADPEPPDIDAILGQMANPAAFNQAVQSLMAGFDALQKAAGNTMQQIMAGTQALAELSAKYAAWQMSEPLDDGTSIDQALDRIAEPLATPEKLGLPPVDGA